MGSRPPDEDLLDHDTRNFTQPQHVRSTLWTRRGYYNLFILVCRVKGICFPCEKLNQIIEREFQRYLLDSRRRRYL